ncbi:hypothetical protein ACFL2U_03285, partial [Patescibacteria group bacterium]
QVNYLAYFLVGMIALFFLAISLENNSRAKESWQLPDYGSYSLNSSTRLNQYFEQNFLEQQRDEEMHNRHDWTGVTCWISQDYRDYSEEAEYDGDYSIVVMSKLSGTKCLVAYSQRRNVLFQDWLTATTGQIALDMSTSGMQEYYDDFPEEETRDQEMVQREYYNGYCWVTEDGLVYQEEPQKWYQVELHKKFGVECLQAYAQRRNALFLQWKQEQPNI